MNWDSHKENPILLAIADLTTGQIRTCTLNCTNWISSLRDLELEFKGAGQPLLSIELRTLQHWLGTFVAMYH
jgi:hypothetical protein